MSLFWKKYRITFELSTKDNQWFRYATIEFEQKRNLYWLISTNMVIHRCVLHHVKTWFKNNVDLNYMYEGKNPYRSINDSKLEIINKKLNTLWKIDWQPTLPGKIRNIEVTYLVR